MTDTMSLFETSGRRKKLLQRFRTRLGQTFFSIMSHRLYDSGLYKFVTNAFWRCPTAVLLDNYADNVSSNHLEIGVGSGYFLRHTLCADFLQRLLLSDLNRRCLAKSAARLSDYDPATIRQDIRRPWSGRVRGFRSVGINYVLHCIPGRFVDNAQIFANASDALESGGVCFGATLIPARFRDGPASWLLMRVLNALGIFNNLDHRLKELRRVLEANFSKVSVSMMGDAAIFVAVK